MNHFLVTLDFPINEENSQNVIMLRILLEDMSGTGNWHQVLPSLIAIKTDYSIHEVYDKLSSLNTDYEIFIAEVSKWKSNSQRTVESLTRKEF